MEGSNGRENGIGGTGKTNPMVTEKGKTFLHSRFGVQVAADEPCHEDEEDTGEYTPFYYVASLGSKSAYVRGDGRVGRLTLVGQKQS